MFLLVSKFKMIGMLLNFVHGQVQKSQQKHITKEFNGFHNHSTLITMFSASHFRTGNFTDLMDFDGLTSPGQKLKKP